MIRVRLDSSSHPVWHAPDKSFYEIKDIDSAQAEDLVSLAIDAAVCRG